MDLDQMITMAMVVFIGAILVFFSQEIIRTYKKIMAIKRSVLNYTLNNCLVDYL